MTYEINRKKIEVEIDELYSGTLDRAIEKLQRIRDNYTAMGYENLRIGISAEREPYCDSYSAEVKILGTRWEHENEYDARVVKEQNQAKLRRAYAERELARLKAELGEV